ncbi:MAG: transcriptional repressor LexA [Planctomycetota bacterium]
MKASKNVLTEKQQQVLHFIVKQCQAQGFPPTVKEMQDEFDYRSPTTVSEYLRALNRKGYLKVHPKISRGIEILPPAYEAAGIKEKGASSLKPIPLVGRVPAGAPMEAIQNASETISIDFHIFGTATFALKIEGESMRGAGILDRDIVIVKQQNQAEHSDIIVAILDSEATVKRFYSKGKVKKLQPENPNFKEILITPEKSFQVLGKVIGLVRKF